MTAQPGTYIASNNSGELAQELHARSDIKQYYSGLSLALNVEPVPQGGSRLAPRTRYLGRIRRALDEIAAGAPTTSLGPHAAGATIVTRTFTAPAQALAAVVLNDFSSDVALGAILQVEYLDDVTWTAFREPFSVAAAEVKTLCLAAPPGASIAADGVRLRMVSAPGSPATFAIGSLVALAEGELSDVKLRPFTFSKTQTYVAALTGGHADFWRDGGFVGAASTGMSEDRLPLVDWQQRFDTALLHHAAVKSKRILRDGADHQWTRDDLPYSNIPQVDLGGVYVNAVTDIWKIYFRYPTSGTYAGGKDLFLSIEVNGEETAGIGTGGTPDWTVFAADVTAALEGLPSVETGLTVSEDHATGGLTVLTIEFTGAGNVGTRNVMTAQVVNTAEAAATVTHTQLGVPGGEPLISSGAGYAAAAGFYQDRLVTGGFAGKKGAVLASNTAEYFNLNTEIEAASGAILVNLDTDGAEEVQGFSRARHLLIFTTEAEYFISDRVLSRTATPTIVNSSRNGSAPGVPVVQSEDATYYLSPDKETDDRVGLMLYAMSYDDVAQAYLSDPISLTASHIVNGVIDQALQKGSAGADANRLWMVRDDGTMVVGIFIRNQDVTAFVRWQTAGQVLAACVDGKNRPHLAVQRVVGEDTEIHLERLEPGLIFDGTVTQTFEDPVTIVPNLDMHEGAQVWASADGYVVGPFTVAGGAITLADPASEVSVGRWTPPRARLLPIPRDVAERVELRRPIRVHAVRADVIGTTSIAIGANGRPADNVPLYRAGDPTDQPLAPFTGVAEAEGLVDYSDDGIVEITQTQPGLLQWKKITVEAKL